MSLYKYDEERTMRMMRGEAFEAGVAAVVKQGEQRVKEAGIRRFIEELREEKLPPERILEKLEKKYLLSREEAPAYFNRSIETAADQEASQ